MLPSYLTEAALDTFLRQALKEDLGQGDLTTLATVPAAAIAEAVISAKESGTIAGVTAAARVFELIDGSIESDWELTDGDAVHPGDDVGVLRGPASALLSGERLALNLLQRMSGIATATRAMAERIKPYGARLLDTRKTAPGMRLLDKWAVRSGGGHNHRLGLFDMMLVKDNHIAACNGISAAIESAHSYRRAHASDALIEIEVRTLDELVAVLSADPVDWVLLDNMARTDENGALDVSLLQEAVERIDARIATEASGNVTLETAAPIAATGVDAVSCGSLTHSVQALDLSMRMRL